MKVTVLGSGQDGGLPQFAAPHPNDLSAVAGTLPWRSASSLLVETSGIRILLDASPDLRTQWAGRTAPPDAIALTHGHIGHYAGLVHFGREVANTSDIVCHLTDSMYAFLMGNQPWRQLFELGNLRAETTHPYVCDEYRIDLIDVPHRAEHTDTVAISVDGRLLYLPDIDSWEPWSDARSVIDSHEIAFLDASFWSRDELAGRSVSDVPHPLVSETVEQFASTDTKVVLTHLNHTNPLVSSSGAPSALVADLGWVVASDGLVVEL